MQYLIMCRSLTWAQRSAALLERSGFSLLSITEALTDAAPAETSERIQFAARRNEE